MPERKMVLADVAVTNLSETDPLDLSHIQLQSDGLVQLYPGYLGGGYEVDYTALECLTGWPASRDARDEYDYATLTSVSPGETRALTLPFLVYRNAFEDPAAFDEFDPSRFSLELYDYDPATTYRFHLG